MKKPGGTGATRPGLGDYVDRLARISLATQGLPPVRDGSPELNPTPWPRATEFYRAHVFSLTAGFPSSETLYPAASSLIVTDLDITTGTGTTGTIFFVLGFADPLVSPPISAPFVNARNDYGDAVAYHAFGARIYERGGSVSKRFTPPIWGPPERDLAVGASVTAGSATVHVGVRGYVLEGYPEVERLYEGVSLAFGRRP